LDLFRGTYDNAYVERRLQIGVVHERIGLPAKWYLGGNAVFFQLIVAILARKYRFRPNALSKSVAALNKVMTLDQELVMDTYVGSVVEKIKGLSHQVVQTIEVLAPSARKAAELATLAEETSRAAVQMAEDGATTVQQALAGMSQLKQTAEESVEEVHRLNERISQIGSVIKLLDEFTTDTNVLALNASVQAARSGAQSTGFSVIAENIRKLADESKESLQRVHSLVAEIQDATDATVTAFKSGAAKVDDGSKLTSQLGEAFNALADSAMETATSVRQITENVQEQSMEISKLKEMADRSVRAGQVEIMS
jgi:methyl-accepting chemotaxis protein